MSGLRSMSPPPREENDDYRNIHHHDKRKKHTGRTARRQKSSTDETGGLKDALWSPPSITRTARGKCESCGDSSIASGGESVSDATCPKNIEHLEVSTYISHEPRTTAEFDPINVPTSSSRNSPIVGNRETESPAMNALRSLSQPITPNTTSQTLRRMSTVLAATFEHLAHGNGSTDSSRTSRKRDRPTASQGIGIHRNNFSQTNSPSRRATFNATTDTANAGTPATITLRKASNDMVSSLIMSSSSASMKNEEVDKPDLGAPTSELLAFYSTITSIHEHSQFVNGPFRESANPPPRVEKGGSLSSHILSRSERKKCISMARFNNGDRGSVPAESTLTFTDVHIAPGSFAVEPKSRKGSISSAESNRRISVIHFRSRNSVHEVIWREDETTSSSSLASDSSSPPPQTHSHSLPPCLEEHSGPDDLEQDDDGNSEVNPFRPIGEAKPERLFQWSWDGPMS